jgi:predicted nicotinamide N-methyase
MEMEAFDDNRLDFFDEEIVPNQEEEYLGQLELTFQGLDKPVKLVQNVKDGGCGGRPWISATVLSNYLLTLKDITNLVMLELGAGTGLVGIVAGLLGVKNVIITDIDELVDLMNQNISLNGVDSHVKACSYYWGNELPKECDKPIDIVLIADCIYLERNFQPLLDAMTVLSDKSDCLFLMGYKKRRKADKRFFIMAKKLFKFDSVPLEENLRVQNLHLFKITRRKSTK